MKRAERIAKMEECLNRLRALTDACGEDVEALLAAQDDLRRLRAYYGGKDWFEDRAADEAGRLPEGLRRGVLTEDAAYDLLEDCHELGLRLLRAAETLLQ